MTTLGARIKAWLFCRLPAIETPPFRPTPPDETGVIRPKPERKSFPSTAANITRAQIKNLTAGRSALQ